MKDERKIAQIRMTKFATIALAIFFVGVVGAGVLYVMKIHADGDNALRTAKNARMALTTIGVEYRADGHNLYASNRRDGLDEKAKSRLDAIIDPEGILYLIKYDYDRNEILEMQYREGPYIVTLTTEEDGTSDWKVEYLFLLNSIT